jgi:hypothetical protein
MTSTPFGAGIASAGVRKHLRQRGRLSSVPYTDEQCERFALFVEYLETKREQAQLSPERLIALGGGIKLATYRRITSFRNVWRRRGNADGKLEIPVSPSGMVGILKALSRVLEEDCLAEAKSVWGVTFPLNGQLPAEERAEASVLMEELLHRVIDLPPSQLRLIRDLVIRLRNE